MIKSNPIDLTSDTNSSSSDSVWEELVASGRVDQEDASRKRSHTVMSTNPSLAGPSSLQPMPQNAIKKGSNSELSFMPSYVSPYEDTYDKASSRTVFMPPPPPLQALLPPPDGSSSSSPPIRERVIGLACPKVWDVIGGPRVQKEMPAWAIARKP